LGTANLQQRHHFFCVDAGVHVFGYGLSNAGTEASISVVAMANKTVELVLAKSDPGPSLEVQTRLRFSEEMAERIMDIKEIELNHDATEEQRALQEAKQKKAIELLEDFQEDLEDVLD